MDGTRNAQRILVEISHGRPRRRLEENIKIKPREFSLEQ
jgi:hypothetical protein